jgi:hypothetical protein
MRGPVEGAGLHLTRAWNRYLTGSAAFPFPEAAQTNLCDQRPKLRMEEGDIVPLRGGADHLGHQLPPEVTHCLQKFPAFLWRTRCSAPATAHQVNIRTRLKQGIGGRCDAIHAGNGIKDDVLLLAGIVCRNRR